MSKPDKKIIERIRKLLAMGQGEANENEAAIAMRRALALMAKYNLDMADFDEEVEPRGESFFKKQRGGPWARTIAMGIAQLYFCKYYYMNLGKRNDEHHFVGKQSNREIAEMVALFVIDTIDAEAKRNAVSDSMHSKTQYLNSFRNAASHRIYKRCQDLIKEAGDGGMVEEYSGTTLPVLASMYDQEMDANEQWIREEAGIKLKKSKSRERSTSRAGYQAGGEAGKRVSLRPNLSNKTKPQIGRDK